MRSDWNKGNPATTGNWDLQRADPDFEWPSMSGRMLSWLSAGQALIQVSGLLVILDACFR